MPQARKHPKTYRKLGAVNIIDEKNRVIKQIRPEQWARINRVTGEAIFDKDGMLVVKKLDKDEKKK